MKPYRFSFKAMGSPNELQLFAETAAEAEALAESAIAEVERLEARYSRYRDDSLLAAINRAAASGNSITVDEETAGLLNYAATCHRESGGLFDITSGLLGRLWRFDRGALPDPAELERLLDRIGWDKVSWTPPVLAFPVPGMALDFGGIVKEYAADRVAALCRRHGVEHGLVNLGGDIAAIGPRPDGQPWRIGIRHPRRPGELAETLCLYTGALATSGDYERCLIVDGVRYSHILNPKTGWPVRHLASVSVVADLCMVAGSAATIAMLMEAAGPKWLEDLTLPHYWMDQDGQFKASGL
jgi:thiamine biosynthesis lipoprotein